MTYSVSVIVPVYNRAEHIKPTLQSVAEQQVDDNLISSIEIIIVDDCSSDSERLLMVLNEFAELNIVYRRHEKNRHGAAARNTGVSVATGDFIAFLDSDDCWKQDKLYEAISYLVNNEQAAGIYSKVQRFDGGRVNVAPSRKLMGHEPVGDYLLFFNQTMQTSSIVLRREVAKRVTWNSDLKRFQDYDFCLRLEQQGYRLDYIDKVLVDMTDADSGNRVSNSLDVEQPLNWVKSVRKLLTERAYYTFLVGRFCRYCSLSSKKRRSLNVLFNPKTIYYCRKPILFQQIALLLVPAGLIPAIKRLRTLVKR